MKIKTDICNTKQKKKLSNEPQLKLNQNLTDEFHDIFL